MWNASRFSERVAVLATIDPASTAASTVTTGWVDAGKYMQLAALIATGTLGSSATVDAKFQQATDSSGTGAKDVTGAAITQIVKASGDNKQAFIHLRPEKLDVANKFRYVRLSLTVGTATSVVSAFLFGLGARLGPEGDAHQAAVVQQV